MTKQELQEYRKIEKEIKELRSTMREVESRIYSPRIPKLTGMPSAQNTEPGSAQERTATALFELREQYEETVERLVRKRMRIETAIELVGDPICRRILRMRYIDGRSWKAIIARINASERYVFKMHGVALQEIAQY